MNKTKLALVATAVIFCFACEDKKADKSEQGTAELQKQPTEKSEQKTAELQKSASFTDPRNSKVYKTVAIGKQTWMAENLDYHDELYNGEGPELIVAGNDKYGALYPPNAAQGVCPEGWHLPSQAEWNELINFAGGENAAAALKAKSGWKTNGTDEFGFGALPGGFKRYNIGDGDYSEIATKDVGVAGNWWSSTKSGSDKFYDFHIDEKPGVRADKDGCKGNNYDYGDCYLLSVRCVKN